MRHFQITIGQDEYEIEILEVSTDRARVRVNGIIYEAGFRPWERPSFSPSSSVRPAAITTPPIPEPILPPSPPPEPIPAEKPPVPSAPTSLGTVVAPMPGLILEVLVQVGDQVASGDAVAKLEAMKMENDLRTPVAGTVTEVRVSKGANVSVGEVLVVVAEA